MSQQPPEDDAGLTIVDPDEPRHAAPRKKRRRWIIPLSIFVGLIVIAVVAFAMAVGKVQQVANTIKREPNLIVPSQQPIEPGKPVNVVIMGSDSRSTDAGDGRSDVLMLAHLTADRTKLYLISFPRDMYVSIPGHGKNKINAAFALGGPVLTVQTLNGLLGVKANHTALIDFEGFIGLSEAIGGVTFVNDMTFSAGPYRFEKGTITLSGDALLAYVRERHNVPRGDLDRAHHQRMVLKAMVAKIMSRGVMTDVPTLLTIADQIGGFITVDANLTNDELISTVTSLQLSASGIVDLQAPISGFGRTSAGASIDVVDEKKMAALAEAVQQDTMAEYVQDYGTGY